MENKESDLTEETWKKKIFQDKDLAETFQCKSCNNIPKRVYMCEKEQIYCKTCINSLKNENKIKTIKFDDNDTNTMEQIMFDSLYLLYCPNNPDDYLIKNKNKINNNNNNNNNNGGQVDFATNKGGIEGSEGQQEGGGHVDEDDDDKEEKIIEKNDKYCYDFCNKQLSLLNDHLANECKIKIVSCPFYRINKCTVNNIKKNELSKHLNKEKVGHLKLLIELINENNKGIKNIKDMQKECDSLLTEYKKESDINLKEYKSIKQQITDIKKDQNIEDDDDDNDDDNKEDEIKDNNDDDIKQDNNNNKDEFKYEETLKLLKEMFPDKNDNELKNHINQANGDAQVAMNALLG